MPGALGDLVISLHADTAKFASDMGRAAHISEREWRKVARSAGEVGAQLGAVGALGAAALFAVAKQAIDTADEVGKMAQRVGLSAEQLSALEYSAKLSDVSIETLGQSLKKLSVNMFETQANTGDAKEAFKALGLSVEASKGNLKSSEQILFEIADKFAAMEDGAGKTALAVKLFGRAGSEMIPMLNGGAEGLRKNTEEARRFGIVLSTEATKRAEEFNDNLTRLSESGRGMRNAIAQDMLPWLNKLVEQLLEGTKQAGGFWAALMKFSDINPFRTTGESVAKLKKTIEEFQETQKEMAGRGVDTTAIDAQIKGFQSKLEFARFMQRQEALLLPGGDTPGEAGRMAVPKVKAPALPDEAAMKKMEELKKLYAEVAALGAQIDVSVPFIKDKEQLEKIKKTLQEGIKDWLAYADAVFNTADAENAAAGAGESFTQWAEKNRDKLLDMIDPLRAIKREHEDIDKLVATGWMTEAAGKLAKLDPALRALLQPLDNIHQKIQSAWEAGLIDTEQMRRASAAALENTERTTDEMTEFWRQGARNMQDAMSGFFFDIMQGNLKDLGASFKRTVDKMVSDVLAAKAAAALFGPEFTTSGAGGGNMGGLVGAAMNWLTGGSGGVGTASMAAAAGNSGALEGALLGSFDVGTPYVPRTGIYRLHEGERVVPKEENMRGGEMPQINQTFSFSGDAPNRKTMTQIGAAAFEGARRAYSRNR